MRIPFLTIFLFLLFVSSCKERNQETVDVTQSLSPIKNPDFEYLTDEKNVKDSLYLTKAKKTIDYFLSQEDTDSATLALYHVTNHLFANYIDDSTLTYTTIQLVDMCKPRIPDNYWGFFHRFIASYFTATNELDSSIFYLNRGLISSSSNHSVIFNNAKIQYDLITRYLHKGDLSKALTSGQKSIELYKSIDSTKYLAPVYSGIACVHLFEDSYSNALMNEQFGYELAIEAKDSAAIYVCTLNKINLYHSTNHPNLVSFIDSALVFAQDWIPKSKNPNAKQEFAAWKAYREAYEGNLQQAKTILDEIKPYVLSVNNYILTDYYANALSLYELKSKKGAEDPSFYTNQIKDLIEYQDYGRLQLFYTILADDAAIHANYKDAYQYTRLAETAKDSMSNLIVRDRIAQLDKSYQTTLKEKTIEVQKAELSQKRIQITFLGVALLIISLSTTAYIFWQKQKALQKEKKSNLSFTKLLFQHVEDERRRIANDLHDSINHDLLLLKNSYSEETQEKSRSKIDHIIQDIRNISKNLHPVLFEKIGLIPTIHQLIERIEASNQFMVSLEIDYHDKLSSDEELQIYRIIQESLSNCIKYANAYAAKVTLKTDTNAIHLQILDNGKGFDVALTLENKKSFGLHSIIERSKALGGNASIQSSAKGTEIYVYIPLKKS